MDSLKITEDRLGIITLLTDAYLGHLGVDDLLQEITAQVAQALGVDTVAVFLRDGRSDHLVARAAYGIEEEVHQGIQVPVGQGFAGAIAADARPAVVERVEEATGVRPLLWEKGVRALLGVPVLDGPRVIGVLHVGSAAPRAFTDEDTKVLQLVAERVASAVLSRDAEVERAAAQVLQRSLLPASLPHCPGVEFATRYVAAATMGVGGDWYDAFRLPSGELWVMVGDVAGHGLVPAVIMGRLRATLRSYALEGRSPEEVLVLADRKLEFFEAGFMATALVAVSAPPYDTVRLTSAGHPPPVLAVPGRPSVLVDLPVRPVLGAGVDDLPSSTTIAFPPGATLLAYTDGLIERRGEPLDVGMRRLVEATPAADPEEVCGAVMEALIGSALPSDDIAVVAMRRAW